MYQEYLNWSVQFERISKKIAYGIGILKRSRSFVPFKMLLCIYNALVKPHFDYCSVVWSKSNKTLATKLQKLQNRAARILTISSHETNADDLFVRLGWKKPDIQRKSKTATLVYISINGLAAEYLRSLFTDRREIFTYSLRDSEGNFN